MSYRVASNKEEAKRQLEELINAFQAQYDVYSQKSYSEAQLRIDFLNPFLKTLGWDVDNEQRKSQFLRDVIQEEAIEVEEEDKVTKKNPDYTLRVFGERQLFIEAKKASIDIRTANSATFQTRRYGWSANLGVSVLTNFEYLIFFDCRTKPSPADEAHTSRYKVFHFQDYLTKFEEIYELLSFESIKEGSLNSIFPLEQRGGETFDDYFLEQIELWRKKLAQNIVKNNHAINQEDINFLIQRLLNRIIFLRICEDREIEKYETLKSIQSYEELKALFKASDKKYNSGLFDFIEDNLTLTIHLDNEVLLEIFNELYYPVSPYDFTVIDPTILSQIYEKYLGSRVELLADNQISIVEEPEVAASNGVVPTPKKVVRQIVKETLAPLFERNTLETSENLKLADICCGSGTFLISIYDYLVEKRTEFLLDEGIEDENRIYQSDINTWKLTIKEKQNLLHDNIFGVDINPYAVEVSRFSLLLKLLENENGNTVDSFLNTHHAKVLPSLDGNIKCGNSLIDSRFLEFDDTIFENDELLFKIKLFDWIEEFPFLAEKQGFDAIVGNPPYVRIQNLMKYSREEINYYKSKHSPFSVSKKDGFDKYYIFIERAIELLNPTGLLGYIVPHKFFIAKGGQKLRKTITEKTYISKIIHFGVTQIFPERSTYTAILILDKKERATLSFSRINNIHKENAFENASIVNYQCDNYTSLPWVFISKQAEAIFEKMSNAGTTRLKSIADISVGVQTSADKIYIFEPIEETESTYIFEKNGHRWQIEKSMVLPSIYDVSLNLFDTPQPNSYIIFPYKIRENKAVVFSEAEMLSNYPLCWEYLNFYKAQLEKRSINGKDPVWYQFGRSQSLTKFHNTDKLIFSVLSTEQSYTYDKNNILFTGGGNGPYYSILSQSNYSILYIMGVLSHPVIEAMVKSRASEFRGNYYSHGKQFIQNLPIRQLDLSNPDEKQSHDNIVNIVQNLIATKAQIKGVYISSKRKILERKYNRLWQNLINSINQLYNITAEEVESISGNKLFIAELD